MEKKTLKMEEEKGFTFSPSINVKSKHLSRKVENLYLWDEVRKIKQNEKKKILDHYENMLSKSKSSFLSPNSKQILIQKQDKTNYVLQNQSIDRRFDQPFVNNNMHSHS
jgi:hypothetical protein